MKVKKSFTLMILLSLIFAATAGAEIRIDGYLIATGSCEALQSIRKKTNPGSIRLTEDMAYEVISKNKANATHYRIRVKGASPKERWVPISCGKLLMDCREQAVDGGGQPPRPSPGPQADEPHYLLALSWQPAFCQNHQAKLECETQTADRYDATHFTLHGLWPQPRENIYCNVDNNLKKKDKRKMWEQLPEPVLTEETYGDLMETMPGVASYLHRHEWIKHGTCYSTTPEEYYRESVMLADQVNASEVRDLFASNIGQSVSTAKIKETFDRAFGPGAGDRVNIRCSNGMITELWINLRGEIEGDTPLSELLDEAAPASPSCQSGAVDPVGY